TAGLTFKWLKNNVLIANQTKDSLLVDSAYNYRAIVSNTGCSDTSNVKYLTVHPLPKAGFTINNASQCLNSNNFIFTDTSKITTGSTSRLWTVNGIDTSTNITTNKSFANVGTYTIKLLAISNYGCKDSITKTVSVNPIPKAGFTINNASQCVNGNNFSFNDTSNIASGTLTRKWNLGTGNNDTSLLASTNKSYSLANNYFIKLIVTSNYGCKDSISKSVVVHPKPAVNYIISNPTQCLKGNSFSFTDTSSITYGTIERKWNFGTGNLDTSTNANPVKNYTTPNTYTVKLVATSNNNCKDSISKPITVNPQPSAIIITIGNTDFCANKNVILKANQAASQTYSWLKNDSLIPQNNDSILLVSTGGTYQLVIKNIFNCIDTSTKTT
ncbi:MAG: PKD domain-containing protein, partial [Dolichospermum sp.]